MRRLHRTMLIVGVVLILVGVLLPLVALTGLAHGLVPAPPDGVLPQLQVAFWALAIGIPLSAAGCTLAAVAIVLHRYGRGG